MTYNEQETTWNDLQRARNHLERPTTSQKRPQTTHMEQETTYKDLNFQSTSKKAAKPPTTSRCWDYFTVWDNRFSSLTRFPPNIWLQNPAFCLALYLTGVHFRGELQHVGHVGRQKIKCWPIRTWEIAGFRLQDKYMVEDTLPSTLALVNLHLRGKSQPYELSNKIKFWHRSKIQTLENDCLVVFIPSHWKTTECWLYFASQIELKGLRIS